MKKLLLFILALTLTFCFTACNDETDSALPSPSAETPSESPDTSPSAVDDEPTYEVVMQWDEPDRAYSLYPEGEEPRYFYDKELIEFIPSWLYGEVYPYVGSISVGMMGYINAETYGFCDSRGKIITAPVYSLGSIVEVDGKQWYSVYPHSAEPVTVELENGNSYREYMDGLIISKDGSKVREYNLRGLYYYAVPYYTYYLGVGDSKTLKNGISIYKWDQKTLRVVFPTKAISCTYFLELPGSGNLLLEIDGFYKLYSAEGVCLLESNWTPNDVSVVNDPGIIISPDGIYDTDGNLIKNGRYRKMHNADLSVSNKFLLEYLPDEGMCMVCDMSGEPVIDTLFKNAYYVTDELFLIKIDSDYALSDIHGNLLSPLYRAIPPEIAGNYLCFRTLDETGYAIHDFSGALICSFDSEEQLYLRWSDGKSFLFSLWNKRNCLVVSEKGEIIKSFEGEISSFEHSFNLIFTLDIANGLIRTYTPDGKQLTTVYSYALQAQEYN